MTEETLGSYQKRLFGQAVTEKLLKSPPDLFGFAAYLLHRTGAYIHVVEENWLRSPDASKWPGLTRQIGQLWRKSLIEDSAPPRELRGLWSEIEALGSVTISSLTTARLEKANIDDKKLLDRLLRLLSVADEASNGLGLPASEGSRGLDAYERQTMRRIVSQPLDHEQTTLCDYVDPSLMAVLPKSHTPSTGITIRSLSHHLALIPTGEVKTKWFWAEAGKQSFGGVQLNVVVFPWPLEIAPRCFRPAKRVESMPDGFDFFEYQTAQPDGWLEDVCALLNDAERRIGDVDLVVFPELALSEAELGSLSVRLLERESPPMIVAGTLIPSNDGKFARNACVTLSAIVKDGEKTYAKSLQDKHHRWRLDPRQVKQYGLGGRLSPSRSWWEAMEIRSRQLKIFALKPWLTLCTLICEDLARPDPIADTVRAIGPNLVIALLMDGPQLKSRWPARYGSVLADDPGSSVLTVTSLGMSLLSTPGGCSPSRVVALWKDSSTGVLQEIELPRDSRGLALCLTREESREFSADGRDCGGTTSHVTLSGVHSLRGA